MQLLKERKNNANGMAPTSRNESIVDYKLKYGSMAHIRSAAIRLNVPLLIKKCPYQLCDISEIKNFNAKSYAPASCNILSVTIDPLAISMPVFVHEALHYFAFNKIIPKKIFLSLMVIGRKIVEKEINENSLGCYDNKTKVMGYTFLEHEYAAIAAEKWADDPEIYKKITNNSYDKDSFIDDLSVFAERQCQLQGTQLTFPQFS